MLDSRKGLSKCDLGGPILDRAPRNHLATQPWASKMSLGRLNLQFLHVRYVCTCELSTCIKARAHIDEYTDHSPKLKTLFWEM